MEEILLSLLVQTYSLNYRCDDLLRVDSLSFGSFFLLVLLFSIPRGATRDLLLRRHPRIV